MTLTELLGVLGFGLALFSLGWQIHSHRPRLRLLIDPKQSGFFTAQIDERPKLPGLPGKERVVTVVSIVVDVSNVSPRPNTITAIDCEIDTEFKMLPDNTPLYLGHRSLHELLGIDHEISVHWGRPALTPACPFSIGAGEYVRRSLALELHERRLAESDKLLLTVIARDSYGRTYRRRTRLSHLTVVGPDVSPVVFN